MKYLLITYLFIFQMAFGSYIPNTVDKKYLQDRTSYLQASNFFLRTTPNTNKWNSIEYGAGKYCAVGTNSTSSGGQVMSSPYGYVWTAQTSATNSLSWNDIVYANSLFVVVGIGSNAGQDVMTSPDCVTWTGRTASNHVIWNSVEYGASKFVALGTGTLMYSSDGTTWTNGTLPSNATPTTWTSIVYNGSKFVAVGSTLTTGHRAMYSTDGTTWTTTSSLSDQVWNGVTYGKGLFVAVSDNSKSGTSKIATSPDGITWTERTNPRASDNFYSVTWSGSMFLAVGQDVSIYSLDGINWLSGDGAYGKRWLKVHYGNNMFTAVSNAGDTSSVMTSLRVSQ